MTTHSSPAPLSRVIVEIVGSPFHALVDPTDGAILAAGFETPGDPEAASLLTRLAKLDPVTAARGVNDQPLESGATAEALRAYAAGDTAAIDHLPVRQPGPPFRNEVWQTLRLVEPGKAVTYSVLAEMAGRPRAIRAAASGCATNLVALVVPCHRIVRSDGGFGGYLFGTDIKERLLAHEHRFTDARE
ncbi:methylated-DNA--[protein]-cysteine S-methyltransferase [Leucobacter sp. UT-8R-CII-1-4]|uniref:methylated-DNA--[protein]-cysteine S-methyltransferase n=1 Tax=Leucobacter sp. UT-8R-CII-1-4 TaxID=3040075 RepID=UPI0024A7C7E4|nr:methylated-DNA--[protein]-cysteine S-methyltransferase [Leucobacter sp. UT-8R-CII-1-4]MDI6022261.1 methylated-DNA--[protein]-cysteine S-methyltransferase [Leucobacter sp. UT-8R-CII-1-4]